MAYLPVCLFTYPSVCLLRVILLIHLSVCLSVFVFFPLSSVYNLLSLSACLLLSLSPSTHLCCSGHLRVRFLPIEANTSLRSSLLMMPSLFWSMIVKAWQSYRRRKKFLFIYFYFQLFSCLQLCAFKSIRVCRVGFRTPPLCPYVLFKTL